MSNLMAGRESEMITSENMAFIYTSENEKEKLAKRLLGGLGNEIKTNCYKTVKYRKPLKVRLKELFRRIFGINKKELYKKLDEIENSMINYKG